MSEIRCKEWVSTGGKYVEKGYTTQEVKAIFSEGDLAYQMAIEIERLTAENKLLNDVYEAAKRVNAEVWADDAGGYDPAWFEVEEAIAAVQEGKDDE